MKNLPQHQSRRIGGTVRGFASDNREKPRALARGGSHIGLLIISHGWGGAEEVVYQLARHLLKFQVNVSLFLNEEIKDYYTNIKGLLVYTLGSTNPKNKFTILYSYYKMRQNLIKILKTKNLDLIHVHLGESLKVYFGLPNRFKMPVVFTLHGSEINNFFDRKSFLDYLMVKDMLEKARVVTSPSRWQIENLEKKYKLKTIIVSNGVDTKGFKPVKVKKEINVILFVGRFVEAKGIPELIGVAKLLPEYKFWFAGYGSLAELISLPNTKDLGFKTRIELVELYNQATVCCFPSYYEAFGIVGLEAMACGKPVIATKLGFSEFIENGKDGLLIEQKNKKELKEAIVKLMENTQLREALGKNARRKALKYDWRKIIKRYYFLYKNVTAK